MRRLAEERPDFIRQVYTFLEANGPMTASQLEAMIEHHKPQVKQWGWNWSDVKVALEVLFWSGDVVSFSRTSQFQRRYDIAARSGVGRFQQLTKPEAIRRLVAKAAQACGIGTVRCFADYYRLNHVEVTHAVTALVEQGILFPVQVDGWNAKIFRHYKAKAPQQLEACSLLSPFDSLIFERRRTESLFGFRYRIELYTPASKRTYGYYVLPFLLGDMLVARVDLRANRSTGTLQVLAAFSENGAPTFTPEKLALELQELASWLQLTHIEVARKGDLAASLLDQLRGVVAP